MYSTSKPSLCIVSLLLLELEPARSSSTFLLLRYDGLCVRRKLHANLRLTMPNAMAMVHDKQGQTKIRTIISNYSG
jgi:hypothetical protein